MKCPDTHGSAASGLRTQFDQRLDALSFALMQHKNATDQAVIVVELDPQGTLLHAWSTGGETLALSPDGAAVYMAWSGPANSGWPYLRKYALPTP